jgi:hypothetical protein
LADLLVDLQQHLVSNFILLYIKNPADTSINGVLIF